MQRYDHTANKLVFYRPTKDISCEAETRPGQRIRTRVEQPPLFIGGEAALAAYMAKLNYPVQAQNKNIQGRVLVSFAIDTLGCASGHGVPMGIGGGGYEEALQVCRLRPSGFRPAWLAQSSTSCPSRFGCGAAATRREQGTAVGGANPKLIRLRTFRS